MDNYIIIIRISKGEILCKITLFMPSYFIMNFLLYFFLFGSPNFFYRLHFFKDKLKSNCFKIVDQEQDWKKKNIVKKMEKTCDNFKIMPKHLFLSFYMSHYKLLDPLIFLKFNFNLNFIFIFIPWFKRKKIKWLDSGHEKINFDGNRFHLMKGLYPGCSLPFLLKYHI